MSVRRLASRVACASGLAMTAAATIAGGLGIRGIVSPSMPRGLYWTEPFSGIPQRGDTVEVCLPSTPARLAKHRGYLARGIFCDEGVQRVAKAVFAIPGDTVVVTATGFQLLGHPVPNTRGSSADSRGRPLTPMPPGLYRVQPGTVWLFSTESANSFDSRYYGAVSQSSLRRRYHPLWTEPYRSVPVFSRRRPPARGEDSPRSRP